MKELTLSTKIPIRLNFFRTPTDNFKKRNFRLSVTFWKFHALLSFNLYPDTEGINVTIPIKTGLNKNGDYIPKAVMENAINEFSQKNQFGFSVNPPSSRWIPTPQDQPIKTVVVDSCPYSCGYKPDPKDKPITEGYQPTIKSNIKPPSNPPKNYEGLVH